VLWNGCPMYRGGREGGIGGGGLDMFASEYQCNSAVPE
jgi:hypothetical protein